MILLCRAAAARGWRTSFQSMMSRREESELALRMDKSSVRSVFDRIAPRYDLANDVLSFGYHRLWERLAVKRLALRPGDRLLDTGAGSGRMSARARAAQPSLGRTVLLDLSEKMLRIAQREVPGAICVCGDGEALPFAARAFDAAILAYSLRNMPDRPAALRELHRTLRPGAHVAILEFSRPSSRVFAAGYFFYLCRIIPILGGWITGDRPAYEHLRDSIRDFPGPEQVRAMLVGAGFEAVESNRLTLGISTLYVARRPNI